jgi:hypothetical protein
VNSPGVLPTRSGPLRFEYDLDAFRFFVDGVRCWSPTSVLAVGDHAKRLNAAPEWARERGSAVARAVRNYVLGLDSTVHYGTPLEQFVNYLDDTGSIPLATEFFLPAILDGIAYVAIPDLLVRERPGHLALVQIKCGPDHPDYGLQTAAEAEACSQNGIFVDERILLHLKNTTYVPYRHRRPRDLSDFAARLNALGPRSMG